MSVQIAKIVLYSHDCRSRTLPFQRGALNVITGPPLRGKSQLIEIIDYCLGRGTPNLAPGPITLRVSWYAMQLSTGAEDVFIARRAGHNGRRSSEEVFVDRAVGIVVPAAADFRATHNVEGLIEELNGLLGIRSNEIPLAEDSGREPFKATVRHAALLCFQAQHEIANPSFLFHRQSEDNGAIGRDLLATLPYFLGAMSEESVSLEAEATRVRRELRVAERRRREEELVTQDRRSRADTLLAEATAVGLAQPIGVGATYDSLLQALTALASWTPKSTALTPQGDAYQQALRLRENGLRTLQRLRRDIDEAKAYAAEQSAFVAELEEQRSRLRSVGLYEHLRGQDAIAITDEILNELKDVEKEIEGAVPPTSDLGLYIEQLESERATALAQVRQADDQIEALSTQVITFSNVRDIDLRQAAVVGRVSLFLESVSHTSESGSAIARRADDLKTRLDGLEERIDALDGSANLTESLGQVGGLMMAWAGELGHEYEGARWRLDEKRGTVVTRGPLGTVPMNLMGGGKNHLGCHLFAHIALHSWLRGNAAPIPGFLFLDRPTIGFYENQPIADDPMMENLGSADQQYVRRLFEWIGSAIKGLGGELQVIVTEHVRLNDLEVFSNAIVEDWWVNDGALVPIDWPEAS
jgi:hypothetical protein